MIILIIGLAAMLMYLLTVYKNTGSLDSSDSEPVTVRTDLDTMNEWMNGREMQFKLRKCEVLSVN